MMTLMNLFAGKSYGGLSVPFSCIMLFHRPRTGCNGGFQRGWPWPGWKRGEAAGIEFPTWGRPSTYGGDST